MATSSNPKYSRINIDRVLEARRQSRRHLGRRRRGRDSPPTLRMTKHGQFSKSVKTNMIASLASTGRSSKRWPTMFPELDEAGDE